jgi:hypothetical protein
MNLTTAVFEESRTRHRHVVDEPRFWKKGECLLVCIGVEFIGPLDIYACNKVHGL